MKKYKNIFLSCLLLIFSLYLFGCTKSYTVTFVDYDGTVLSEQKVEEGKAAVAPENPSHEGFEFIKWSPDFDKITSDLVVNAAYIDTRYTDGLKMDFDYKGKNFITDGVGKVKLNKVVDGDTINVFVEGENKPITIRFLGIDTPESTGTIQAWGKVASKFAKDTLYNAESIVLEREGEVKDSGGKRYLAWVWYRPTADSDFRLFNLEEVEQAFTKYSSKPESKYHDVFRKAYEKTKMTGKHVYGEKDPNFNYSKETLETNLLNLWYNHDKYQSGTYFYVTVRMVRTVGNNMYLEDAEEESLEMEDGSIITGKGHFYAFSGYGTPYYRYIQIGDVFKIRCQLEWNSDFGSQLTGISKFTHVIEGANEEPVIPVIDANDLGYTKKEVKDDKGNIIVDNVSDLSNYFCQVVTVENLTCVNVKVKNQGADNQYYTATMKNDKGVLFDVYFGNHLITNWKVNEVLQPGKKYSITAGVGYHAYSNGYYQLSLGDGPRYSKGVLNPLDIIRVNDIKEMK